MLDTVSSSIARTIVLNLSNLDGLVVERPAPTRCIAASGFVDRLFPGHKIEHLARAEMADITNIWGSMAPSSLFFQTVHRAYSWHHALGLRPEVLMYLINAVVAETVRRHPHDYRELFTSESGRRDIHIRYDGLTPNNLENPWDEAIEQFEQALQPHVPSRIMSQMLPEFSTANQETQLASLIGFMDAASPYYDFHAHTLCGIPRIVLFGNVSDYRRLVIAAIELQRIFHRHLAIYFANLVPVLETIAKTAETGEVEVDFWGQLYKHFDASGSRRFSGWISAFLWYVHEANLDKRNNPLVEKKATLANWRAAAERDGIHTGSASCHVSSVPFTCHYLNQKLSMRFIAGVLGIDVLEEALTPRLGYGVLRTNQGCDPPLDG